MIALRTYKSHPGLHPRRCYQCLGCRGGRDRELLGTSLVSTINNSHLGKMLKRLKYMRHRFSHRMRASKIKVV